MNLVMALRCIALAYGEEGPILFQNYKITPKVILGKLR